MTHAESAPFNPFPGLRPFRENEEYLFFGREKQVSSMVNKLAENHFLAVLGTSGSGKSSLVNCGLRPALHRGLMTAAGSSWRMAQFRPGNEPIGALAHALSEAEDFYSNYAGAIPLVKLIDTTLRISKRGLLDVFKRAHLPEPTNLLVVVDQFEELFRYQSLTAAADKNDEGINQEAVAFVNLLLEAIRQPEIPVYIVLTMRSDFLGECARFQGLPEAVNAGQFLVPRMTREERRSAIEGPVRVGGARISKPLLTQLVNDVGESPDQLSVLQHALNRTWANWEEHGASGPIELKHYEAVGAMTEALDRHAEDAFEQLKSDREKKRCELVFKALTDKGTDARGVRRPVKFETLCKLTEAEPSEVERVIDVFRDPARSFLMPPAGEKLEPQTVIDISHESLMRIWKRLRRWAEEEARSAQQYRRLAETASLYGHNQAQLLSDPELRLSLQWKEENQPNQEWGRRYDPSFNQAMGFLEKSRKADRRRKQRMKAAWGGLATILLVSLITLAIRAKSQAEDFRLQALVQTDIADAARNTADSLQRQIEALQSELPGLSRDIQELRIANRSLKWEIERLDYQNNLIEINIAGINLDISKNKQIERNLNERISDFTEREDRLTREKERLSMMYQALLTDKQDFESQVDQLEIRNETLRESNDALRREAIEVGYYVNPPEPVHDEGEYATGLGDTDATGLPDYVDVDGAVLNPIMPIAVPDQDSLEAVIQDLKDELALLNMLANELRNLNRELETEAQEARAENQRLMTEEEEAKRALEILVVNIEDLKQTEQSLVDRVDDLRNEIGDLEQKIILAGNQIDLLKREITRLEKENNTLEVENQALDAALARYR